MGSSTYQQQRRWTTPSLDVTITDDNIEEQIRNLVIKIKLDWKCESVRMKKLTGGILNLMYCCWSRELENLEDAVIVRIHKRPRDSSLLDPRKEIDNLEKISTTGFGPELIVLFNNGLCYKYIPGEPLNMRTVRSEKFIPHITKLMARLHSLPLMEKDMSWGIKDAFEFVPDYPPNFKDPTKLKRVLEVLPNFETYQQEVTHLSKVIPKLASPKVYCHNDTKGENFVWNEKEKKLTLVDYEHSGNNNQAFEIGHHFVSYCDVMGSTPDTYPDREFQLRWIRLYLEHWFQFTGKKAKDVTDKDVERLYVQANVYAQMSRLMIGTVLLPDRDGRFDCFEFCLNNLKDYFKYKDEVNALVFPE